MSEGHPDFSAEEIAKAEEVERRELRAIARKRPIRTRNLKNHRSLDAEHGANGLSLLDELADSADKRCELRNPLSSTDAKRILREFSGSEASITKKQLDVAAAVVELIQMKTFDNFEEWIHATSGKINETAVRRSLQTRLSISSDQKTIEKALTYLKTQWQDIEDMAKRSEIDHVLQDLKAAAESWRGDSENQDLRFDVGFRALAAVRIIVNLVVCDGRSRSMLPTAANLDEDEKCVLDYLATQRTIAVDDPIPRLAEAISRFQREKSIHLLGVRAAKAAIAIFGSSLAGLHALLNYYYLLRPVMGEYFFVESMESIADEVEKLDFQDCRSQLRKCSSLMSPAELQFAAWHNAASALAAMIAMDESDDIDADYQRMRAFLEHAQHLRNDPPGFPEYVGHARDFLLLQAEVLAVGACVCHRKSDAETLMNLFHTMGPAATEDLVTQIEAAERFVILCEFVRSIASVCFPPRGTKTLSE